MTVLKGIKNTTYVKNSHKMIIGAVVIAGAFFYGGYAYAAHAAPKGMNMRFSMGANGSMARSGGAASFNTAGGAGTAFRAGGMGAGGGFVTGTVLSKDDQSVTVKLQDGGSKIVFVGGSTQVMKSVAGSIADISVGANVMITGSQNQDGSVTARSVDIRPMRMASTSMPVKQ